MKYVVYGIPNCDTVPKAPKFLADHGVDYRFHDIRADGLDQATILRWCKQLGRDTLLNKRSTGWRQLSSAQQVISSDADLAELMSTTPTLLKRPLLEREQHALCNGFHPSEWEQALA